MHEVIIDRGDAQGLPFEDFVQIMVPWNVVIVHEPKCHLIAQHNPLGRALCISQILTYHQSQTIDQWLDDLAEVMPYSLISKARSHIMKIQATAYDNYVTATIVASKTSDFEEALCTLKSIPAEDRTYNEENKEWRIFNPEKYRHLSFIDNALKTRELQISLF